jgi:hypothetical protein
MCIKNAHTSIQVQRSIPAFPAQWFYGLCRALLGDEFVLATVIGELTALPNPVGFAKPPPI